MTQSLELAFNKLGYRIQNRDVEVLNFPTPGDIEKALNETPYACHALFLPLSETERAAEWVKVTSKLPILLISEQPDFLHKGGEVALAPNQVKPGRFYLPRPCGAAQGTPNPL